MPIERNIPPITQDRRATSEWRKKRPARPEKEYNGLLQKLRTRFEKIKKPLLIMEALFIGGLILEPKIQEYRQDYALVEFESSIKSAEGKQETSDFDRKHLHELRKEIGDLTENVGTYNTASAIVNAQDQRNIVPRPAIKYEHPDKYRELGFNFTPMMKAMDNLPKAMASSIKAISFEDKIESTSYGEKGNACAAALPDGTLVFYRFGEKQNWPDQWIEEITYHEVAHENDWSNAAWLSPTNRIQLEYAIMKRIQSKDHPKYGEVENMKVANPQERLYDQMTEYWAWIFSEYKMHPNQMNPEDRKIIDWYLLHASLAENKK